MYAAVVKAYRWGGRADTKHDVLRYWMHMQTKRVCLKFGTKKETNMQLVWSTCRKNSVLRMYSYAIVVDQFSVRYKKPPRAYAGTATEPTAAEGDSFTK